MLLRSASPTMAHTAVRRGLSALLGAGSSRGLATAPKTLTCTFFEGDGIGPEISSAVKKVFEVGRGEKGEGGI